MDSGIDMGLMIGLKKYRRLTSLTGGLMLEHSAPNHSRSSNPAGRSVIGLYRSETPRDSHSEVININLRCQSAHDEVLLHIFAQSDVLQSKVESERKSNENELLVTTVTKLQRIKGKTPDNFKTIVLPSRLRPS